MRRHGPTVYELTLADVATGLGVLTFLWSVAAVIWGHDLLPFTTAAGGALTGVAGVAGVCLVLAAGEVRRRRATLALGLGLLGAAAVVLIVLGAIQGRPGAVISGAVLLLGRIAAGKLRGHAARRGYRPQFFSERSFETVAAAADTMLDADGREAIPPHRVAVNVDKFLHTVQAPVDAQIKLLFYALEWALPALLLRRPLLFTLLGERDRRVLVVRLTRSNGTFRTIARTLKVLTCAGYYGDPLGRASVGFVEYEGSPRSNGVDMTPEHYPDPLNNDPQTPRRVARGPSGHYDAIVVGSGASGAVMSYELARRGLKVAIVERGRHEDPQTFMHDEIAMFERVWKDGGLQTAADRNSAIFQGQTVGGSTVINNAIWLPADLDRVLAEWARAGAHVPKRKLEDAYAEIKGNLKVSEINQDVANPGSFRFMDGAGATGKWLDNNRFKCLGCGWCNYGCRYNRKTSMLVTYIPWALNRDVELFDQVLDARIEQERGRATGVSGSRLGAPLKLTADKVIVCAGAIGSSALLLQSEIDARGQVGRRFHALGGLFVTGDMGQVVDGFAGIGLTCMDDGPHDYVLESYFAPPLAFAIRTGGWFLSHFNRLKRYRHFIDGGVMVGTNPRFGSISISGGSPKIDLRPPPEDIAMLREGLKHMARIYFDAGAERVYPSTFNYIDLLPHTYPEMIDAQIRSIDDILFGSAHPQGGNSMNEDPARGVVDNDFRVHGMRNLYVADTSVWPSNIRANCQATTMAMSHYAAERVLAT